MTDQEFDTQITETIRKQVVNPQGWMLDKLIDDLLKVCKDYVARKTD